MPTQARLDQSSAGFSMVWLGMGPTGPIPNHRATMPFRPDHTPAHNAILQALYEHALQVAPTGAPARLGLHNLTKRLPSHHSTYYITARLNTLSRKGWVKFDRDTATWALTPDAPVYSSNSDTQPAPL